MSEALESNSSTRNKNAAIFQGVEQGPSTPVFKSYWEDTFGDFKSLDWKFPHLFICFIKNHQTWLPTAPLENSCQKPDAGAILNKAEQFSECLLNKW